MGKLSGRVLSIFISYDGVRVCEGENRTGDPDILKFFTVRGVEEYFSAYSANRPPEIINMSGLVQAIVAECKNRKTLSRRVMVCSNCFGFETELFMEETMSNLRGALSGDLKALNVGAKTPHAPDKVVCKRDWGTIVHDGRVNKITTNTIGDKYMLHSLVQEFYNCGYEVIYVGGAQEILFNFRHTELASFDSQGKIIFDYDVFCGSSVFVKDVLVETSRLEMIEGNSQIIARLQTQLNAAILHTGRNPRIYLTGSVFRDIRFYQEVADILQADGYVVYDLLKLQTVDMESEEMTDEVVAESIITADYSACIAMMMNNYSRVYVDMTPRIGLSEIFRRNAKAVATLVLAISLCAFIFTAVLAVQRVVQIFEMKNNPSQVGNIQSQISLINMEKASLNSTIQTLTRADNTVLELFSFIEKNKSDTVRIVSVDTVSMLTNGIQVEGDGITISTPAEDPVPTGDGYVREDIVIRGYAKTGNDAVNYYNKLFKTGLLADPVLNGVERYTLPNGEEVYIFEIMIGGVIGE